MNRRAAVLAALAASFLPVPAPAADVDVPVARVGDPIAGEAPAASLLRRATLTATAYLPGRMLGLRLPAAAWQAGRVGPGAATVSVAAPPYLLTAEQLAQIAWRTWWYAAAFGEPARC